MKQYPKIGIRPIIDARRLGIRDELEGKTAAMAKAAVKLISENVRYADGTPVQCVTADTKGRGEVLCGKCRRDALGHAELVLSDGDH